MRLLIKSKIFLSLIILMHTTSIIASEIANSQFIQDPSQSLFINGRDIIGELFNEDNTLSYDAVLMFLEELENGDLEKVCTEEDLYKIDNFLAFLVKKGILPNMPEEDQASLEKDVQDLLFPSEGDIMYENTFYASDNYSIIPCIYNEQCKIIFCKGWCSKAWKKTKKFVKEHKKEIVIGTVIVVAAVAVVIASSAAATSVAAAGAAGAVAAGAAAETDSSSSSKDTSLSHEEQSTPSDQLTENITGDQALKIFDDQITDYQNIISENNLLSSESINLDPNYQDNERIIGSILAHESLNNIPPAFSYEGYDDMLIKGHGVIDNAFSTNQTSSYLDNNIYNSPDQNLKENLYYYQGQEALNKHSYDKAIEDFGKVLEVNPYNPDVYLDRAYTYFEMGDVDNSLKDYEAYNEQQAAPVDRSISFGDCIDFSAGVTTGVAKGAVGSTKQMLLFAANAITHPLDTSVGIYEGFSNLSKLAVSQEWKLLSQSLAPEVCDLVDEWNNLSMKDRGEKSGYIVGKYGADILMPTASAKAISQGVKGAKELAVIVKNLEKTERLMPLEALAGGSSEVFAETVYSWKIAEEVVPYSRGALVEGFNIKKLAEAGKVMDRAELTKAGRALAKHGGRKVTVFPKPKGPPSQINQQGQAILESILNNPGKTVIKHELPKFGNVIDIKIPGKYGVRYYQNGNLIGFLEP